MGSYDSERFPVIEKFAELAHRAGLTTNILICDKRRALSSAVNPAINIIRTHIAPAQALKLLQKSRIALDFHKSVQSGLSFRVFEAMGMSKKLITTNPNIVDYDFYRPNNIFVWDQQSDTIPQSFLTAPYEELDPALYAKYSAASWVKKILA